MLPNSIAASPSTPVKKAILLAAGRGTRMRELTNDLPKPMIAVRGKPILQHILEGLRAAGITDVLIIVGYRKEVVTGFFGDGERFGLRICYATQIVQDGTGRVVELGKEFAGNEPFILSYGDILVDPVNYRRLARLGEGEEALISVKKNEDVSKGGAVFVNDRMELTDLREKPQLGEPTSPWYNAGIYTFRPSIFDFTAKLERSPRGEYELTDAIRAQALALNEAAALVSCKSAASFGTPTSCRIVQAYELTGAWADVRDPEVLAELERKE